MAEEKKKKKIWCLWRWFIIFWIFTMIWVFSQSANKSTTTPPVKEVEQVEVKEEKTLQEHYNRHKNYLWLVCQEWLKLIDWWPYNFEWPTYAGEYMWKFIIKGTNNNRLFRCEYVPYDNKWWMNLQDVRYEE